MNVEIKQNFENQNTNPEKQKILRESITLIDELDSEYLLCNAVEWDKNWNSKEVYNILNKYLVA